MLSFSENNHPSFKLKKRGTLTVIPWADILCMEYRNRRIIFTMTSGAVLHSDILRVAFQSLIEPLIASGGFIQPHQSFLAAARAIQAIGSSELILQNEIRIPLSKLRRHSVRQEYVAHCLSEGVNQITPPNDIAALEKLPCGACVFHQVGAHDFNEIFVNQSLCRFMGMTAQEVLSHDDILWRVHPEDIPAVKEYIALLSSTTQTYRLTYRLRRRGGAWGRVYAYARRVLKGGVARIYAVYTYYADGKWPARPLPAMGL